MSTLVEVKNAPIEYGVEVHMPKNLVLIKHHSREHGWLMRAELRDDAGNVIAASPDVVVGTEPGQLRMAAINALCFVPTLPLGDFAYDANVLKNGKIVKCCLPVRSWQHVKDVMVGERPASPRASSLQLQRPRVDDRALGCMPWF